MFSFDRVEPKDAPIHYDIDFACLKSMTGRAPMFRLVWQTRKGPDGEPWALYLGADKSRRLAWCQTPEEARVLCTRLVESWYKD